MLPENYRLCLYGLAAAVKQLKFDEALEFYGAGAGACRDATAARGRFRHRCSRG